MKFKKAICALLCGCLLAGMLTACGNPNEPDSGTADTTGSSVTETDSGASPSEKTESTESGGTSDNTENTEPSFDSSEPTSVRESEPTSEKKPPNKPQPETPTKTPDKPVDKPVTPQEPEKPQPPQVHNAGKGDEQAVAQRTLEYINQFRVEGGVPAATKLPGLTKFSEYRSKQLVSNFAHDTDDYRAAAAALKYGEYIDPIKYGIEDMQPYYRVNAREAIGKAGYSGTIDYVAKSLALGFKNSPGHWAYVGNDAEYQYIAVGVTYESGMWYCTVCTSGINTDLLK